MTHRHSLLCAARISMENIAWERFPCTNCPDKSLKLTVDKILILSMLCIYECCKGISQGSFYFKQEVNGDCDG